MALTKVRPSSGPKGVGSFKGGIQFGEGTFLISGATTPVNGTSGTGAGWAGPGSIYTAIDTGELYTNTNTKASPTWTNQT
jgi:hypothetical protein